MTGIYLASTMAHAGKSLFAFSLGVLLQKTGRSVGYMRPLGRSARNRDEGAGDADALTVQEVLGQTAPPSLLSPVMLPENIHALSLLDRSDRDSALKAVALAYGTIAAGKDVTLVSGTGQFPATGSCCNANGLAIMRDLGLKLIFVERLTQPLNYDQLLLLKDLIKDDMLGVVLNDVPANEMRDAEEFMAPWLRSCGIEVLGIMGHEPKLAAIRIQDLARGLNGKIVAGSAQNTRSVQSFLIGTMQVDNFMMHLRQKPGSAVIVGGDRADLQLAAIHAASSCIILTGNIPPSELVKNRAGAGGITLISVREDTYTVARSMTRILRSKKLLDLSQIRLAISLAEKSLDMARILHLLDRKPSHNEL